MSSFVPSKPRTQVGVISDTHGLLRPEALCALEGSDLILHAGDIGSPEVLAVLGAIAPVVAVRGNNDKEAWAAAIPEQETIQLGPVSLHMLHIIRQLTLDPGAVGIRVIISGHSHKPSLTEEQGVLFLNPGSAGPRRFKLPVSVAHLYLEGLTVQAKLIELNP